jgi:hypothetical protein
MKLALFALFLIGCLSWGCNGNKDKPGNEGGNGSTANDGPSAGSAGTSGHPGGGNEDSGGGNASGGHSSSGASQSVGGNDGGDAGSCPATPLASGSPCSGQSQCTYLDCSGVGQVTVSCNGSGSAASLETLPCGPVRCAGIGDCAAGEVCVIVASTGMQQAKCVANPCPGRAVGCDCIGSLCEGATCVAFGTVITCGG